MSEKKTLVQKAIAAYLRRGSPDQPGRGSEEREVAGKRYIILRNVRGVLAVYRQEEDGGVRWQAEWPAELGVTVEPTETKTSP